MPSRDVTELLVAWGGGDRRALDELIPLVHAELRRMARRSFRGERPGHTWQPTALVNELYLKLAGQREMRWQNRAQFFGIASAMMRRLLVDHARGAARQKRGGGRTMLSLEEGAAGEAPPALVDVLDLDAALSELARHDERHAKVVELRFFGGLDVREAAEALGVSEVTVKRDWRLAKAWLFRRLGNPAPRDDGP